MPHPYREGQPTQTPLRAVPYSLRAQLLFGGADGLVGWLLVLLGSSIAWSTGKLWVLPAFLLVFGGVRVSLRLARGCALMPLFRFGKLGRGALVNTRASMWKNAPVVLTFEFKSEDGALNRVEARTSDPAIFDDPLGGTPLLYNPADPTSATLLEHLPGAPRLLADGRVEVNNLFMPFAVLLPLLTVAINLGCLVQALMRQ